MPMRFGPTELITILVMVVMLFGVGRIGKGICTRFLYKVLC